MQDIGDMNNYVVLPWSDGSSPQGQGGWYSNGDGISVDNSKINWTGLQIPANAKAGKVFSINASQAFI